MTPNKIIDSPVPWILAGFIIGLALGVNDASVWLVALGMTGFVVYLKMHGNAHPRTEGMLFASGPAFMMSWMLGFIVHGIAF